MRGTTPIKQMFPHHLCFPRTSYSSFSPTLGAPREAVSPSTASLLERSKQGEFSFPESGRSAKFQSLATQRRPPLPPPHALLPLPPPLARESRLAPLFASVCARSTSSALAKELIANLLNVEPAARLTAPQVLCSPWCRASDMRLD